MLNSKNAPAAQCDPAAIQRNLAFGRKYKITGTPTVIFPTMCACPAPSRLPRWKSTWPPPSNPCLIAGAACI
jgi:hypothetical protein